MFWREKRSVDTVWYPVYSDMQFMEVTMRMDNIVEWLVHK